MKKEKTCNCGVKESEHSNISHPFVDKDLGYIHDDDIMVKVVTTATFKCKACGKENESTYSDKYPNNTTGLECKHCNHYMGIYY